MSFLRMALCCLTVLGLWTSSVLADFDVYRVSTLVENRSMAEKSLGIQRAFNEVLVRASGRSDVVVSPVVAKAKAETYVETFGFSSSSKTGEPVLEVVFNEVLVSRLLRNAGYPVWGGNRPTVMMWIGVEDAGRQLVEDQPVGPLSVFSYSMVKRGVPAVWPLGDLQDDMALPLPKLFGLFRQDIRTATERYPSTALVAARVSRLGAQWSVEGFLEHRGQSIPLSFQSSSLNKASSTLADKVAMYFSRKYGVNEGSVASGAQVVHVSGVSSFGQYQSVLQLIAGTSGVSSVAVSGTSGDVLTLQLSLRASWSQVRSNLRLDTRLLPSAQSDVFEWRGQ